MTEQEFRRRCEAFVRDVLVTNFRQKASDEAISFVADRVFHAIYPAISPRRR